MSLASNLSYLINGFTNQIKEIVLYCPSFFSISNTFFNTKNIIVLKEFNIFSYIIIHTLFHF